MGKFMRFWYLDRNSYHKIPKYLSEPSFFIILICVYEQRGPRRDCGRVRIFLSKVKLRQNKRPRGYKTFFMLNSAEHELSTARKNFNTDK